jgi:thioredoxin-like negative regulator of GroEL
VIAPALEKVSLGFSSRLVRGELNVNENQAMATQFNMTSIPTMIFFKEEKEKPGLCKKVLYRG